MVVTWAKWGCDATSMAPRYHLHQQVVLSTIAALSQVSQSLKPMWPAANFLLTPRCKHNLKLASSTLL